MVEVKVDAIRISLMGSHRVVVLKDQDSNRYLSIWIGQPEADAITIHLTDSHVARPLTHDLIVSLLRDLGATVRYVLVNELRDDTYYARVIIHSKDGKELNIDARPISDLMSGMLMPSARYVTAGAQAALLITALALWPALGWRLLKRWSRTTPPTSGPAKN